MEDSLLYTLPPSELTQLTVGLVTQAVVNGGLLALGTTCILLLSRPSQKDFDGPNPQRATFWKCFILTLLVMNIFYLIGASIFFIEALYGKPESVALYIMLQLCLVSIVSLTDGVMVSSSLHIFEEFLAYPRRHGGVIWSQMRWAPIIGDFASYYGCFPFAFTSRQLVVAGITGALTAIATEGHGYPHVPGAVALVSNAILNVYATAFISICLLRYERSISKAALRLNGSTVPAVTESRHIVQLFLQSSAVNVPVVITAVVIVIHSKWTLSTVLLSIGISFQSFSTLIVLHQVALHKSIG
ncbi:hypothetical protein D9756_006522 [Leucocoprinus leucothites]|uniref:Uncharacterized protein n=1 Tax=Leucocoprinus leucothites TaxID=201217 RepID=A0A8H5LGZ6_9AGAR|nr:hypothetical protein D9756_006522 [Leucoagaricus leucothites]